MPKKGGRSKNKRTQISGGIYINKEHSSQGVQVDDERVLALRSKSLCDVSVISDKSSKGSPVSLRKHESVTNISGKKSSGKSKNPFKRIMKAITTGGTKVDYSASSHSTLDMGFPSVFDGRPSSAQSSRNSFDSGNDTLLVEKTESIRSKDVRYASPVKGRKMTDPYRMLSRPYSIACVPQSASMYSLKNQPYPHSTNHTFVEQRPYSIATPYCDRVDRPSGHSPTLSRNVDQVNWRQQLKLNKGMRMPQMRPHINDEWEDSTSFVIVMNEGPVCPSDPEYPQTAEELMTVSPHVMRNKSFTNTDVTYDIRRISDATTDSGVYGSEHRPIRSLPGTPGANSLLSVRNNSGVSSPELRQSVSFEDDLSDGVDQSLPAGWGIAYTTQGQKYYINHNMLTTHWVHPCSSELTIGLPNGWEVVQSVKFGIYYVNHYSKTAQYHHPAHLKPPPDYNLSLAPEGSPEDHRKLPSRSHSHRSTQIVRLNDHTSSTPRRAKSLKDDVKIKVFSSHHTRQLSTMTYIPPSPHIAAEIPQWLRNYAGTKSLDAPLNNTARNWNDFSIEELDCYQTMLMRMYKKDMEQLVKEHDYYRVTLEQELESRYLFGGHDDDFSDLSDDNLSNLTETFV